MDRGMGMPIGRVSLILGVMCMAASGGCVFYLNPRCFDDIANGDETDIDCGGGTCGQCEVGRSCSVAGDCENGNCKGGTCTPLPCENGVQDGEETDVDCGGTCRKCSGGRACLVDGADGDCFSGTCAGGTCASLAPVTFADADAYPTDSSKPYILLKGDLDRDGVLDLVTANEQADTLTVFRGQERGRFTMTPPFPIGSPGPRCPRIPCRYPTGAALVDIDGDGFLDVATANWSGDSVSVLLGDGNGNLGLAREYATADVAETQNLAVADLDGDQHEDVIAVNRALGSATQFMGQLGGLLGAPTTYAVGSPATFAMNVTFAHLDEDDENVDVVFTGRQTVVRLGNGDGTFGAESTYPLQGGMVVAVDVNLDGRLDLVTVDRDTESVGVLLGRGDGTFRSPLLSTTGKGSGPWAIALADFNLDGVPDVVTSNFEGTDATILLGIGNGRFEEPLSAGELGADGSYGVVTADFNGDGKPDFAISNTKMDDVLVKLNTSE